MFITLTAALALSAPFITAQDLIPDKNEKGKWGYVDNSGKKAIDYLFDSAGNFNKGLALVKKGNSFGMIDQNGKEIIPIKYDLIERHSEHIFRVADNGSIKDGVLMNEKYGFVDDSGKELLKPEFEEIGIFNDGLAYVKKSDKYGYIDDRIQTVIPCKYNAIGAFNAKGYVWVCEGAKFKKNSTSEFSGGKYGIFDRNGNVIVPVKYNAVGTFIPYVYEETKEYLDKLDLAHRNTLIQSGCHHLYGYRNVVCDDVFNTTFSKMREDAVGFYASNKSFVDENIIYTRKNAVFDLQGKLIIKEGKYRNAFYPTDDMALTIDKNGKYNYLNINTGKMLLEKPVYNAWAFEDGAAVISRDGNGMELIDLEGNTVSSTYHIIFPRKDGVYIVQSTADPKSVLYGAIDSHGHEIVPPRQRCVYPPANGMMLCRPAPNEKIGYLDTKGNWLIEPKFEDATSFKHGLADVKTAKGWGLIDPSGKEVVKCRWTSTLIREINNDYIWVSDDSGEDKQYMLLKISKDRLVSKNKYKWARHVGIDFENAALAGSDKDHIGVLTVDGKMVIPAEFNYDQAITAYKYLLSTGKNGWEEFDTYRVKLYSNPNRNKAKLSQKIESSLWDY